ncbi:hypothetical protein AC1031_011465 [Aphanomyces cochlioides]|nr:hypothetical protein AC1031_011465 [Aphanomyces cochlioides]
MEIHDGKENSESSRDEAAEAPSLDVSGVAESPLASTEPGRIIRKKFATVDDVVLLQVVNAFRPWRAPAGTSRGIMKVFDDIAAHCAKHKLFGVNKWPRPTHSFHHAGEGFQKRPVQIDVSEIVSQIDDWNEHLQQEKLQKSEKAMALLKSGEVLKRLAMDEIDNDDANDDDDVDFEDVEESSTTEASSTNTKCAPGKQSIKRRGKISKSERIGAISDALVNALATTDDDERRKNELELRKMEFKRVEAELQRVYQRDEAERYRYRATGTA